MLRIVLYWISVGLLLISCQESAFADQNGSVFMVKIIAGGGRIVMTQGPFQTYMEAADWAEQRAIRSNDNYLFRIDEIKRWSVLSSPIDKAIAQATADVNSTLNWTRDIASIAGMEIPDAGQVLNGYQEAIQRSYENAKELQRGLESLGKVTDKMFEKMNKIIDERREKEYQGFLETVRSMVLEPALQKKETDAKTAQEPTGKLLDAIANSTDSESQEILVKQLRERLADGSLSKGVVAEGKHRRVQSMVDETRKTLVTIQKSIEELERLQTDTAASIKRELTAPPPAVGKWRYNAKFGAIRTMELNANGRGVSTTADGFRVEQQWKIVDGKLWIGDVGRFENWNVWKYDQNRWVLMGPIINGEVVDTSGTNPTRLER